MAGLDHLATYQRCNARICANWRTFQEDRLQHLRERERFSHAAERATENVIESLFTTVLDWSAGDINHQVGYADILLTRLGIKYLIVETKRPGALAWNRRAVDAALEQACRYADQQKVRCVAVSDGHMLYAADVRNGGLHDRVYCSLEQNDAPEGLWWLSIDGIYRERDDATDGALRLLPELPHVQTGSPAAQNGELLHPKYQLPARCFAYVGDACRPPTWYLPYLNADGTIDLRRLPKAIQAILSNYRGAHVTSVPESAIPDVLGRLAQAAEAVGKMPSQTPDAAPAYVQLAAALEQLGGS